METTHNDSLIKTDYALSHTYLRTLLYSPIHTYYNDVTLLNALSPLPQEYAEYAEFDDELKAESPAAEAMMEPTTPLGIKGRFFDRQPSLDRQK